MVWSGRAKTGRDAAEPVYVQGVPGNPRLEDFARSFAWADDKYPIQTPLRDMVDEIMTVRRPAMRRGLRWSRGASAGGRTASWRERRGALLLRSPNVSR